MGGEPLLLLALDLAGTCAFGLNGALTALRTVLLDIVGVITLGLITALGGGIIRDVLLGDLPPATFHDLRYLAIAAAGAFIAFLLGRRLDRIAKWILVLDAAGLSVFAVNGASKALDFGIGPVQAVILGAVTAVGGGTLRDVLIGQIPSVLRTGLYAVPALAGASVTVIADALEVYSWPAALVAATACFLLRLAGVRFRLNAPSPPGMRRPA